MGTCVVGTVAINLISTVLGGLILAFIFFLIKERIRRLPEIAGRWYFEMHTESTSYDRFCDMRLRYVAMVWHEGYVVHGTVEKIYERSSTGERNYIGENRTRGEIQGYIETNYLSRHRLFLHVVETGEKRESTCFHQLEFTPNDRIVGTFRSTVAEQSGAVSWQRDAFQGC